MDEERTYEEDESVYEYEDTPMKYRFIQVIDPFIETHDDDNYDLDDEWNW